MKRGKEIKCKTIALGNRFRIEDGDEMDCKYLGIVKEGEKWQEQMKAIAKK